MREASSSCIRSLKSHEHEIFLCVDLTPEASQEHSVSSKHKIGLGRGERMDGLGYFLVPSSC